MLFLTVLCFNLLSPLYAQDDPITDNVSNTSTTHSTPNITRCRGSLMLRTSQTHNFRKIHVNLNGISVPKTFDARGKWPGCKSISRIQNQESCGGCWAYASVSVMEDRLCIASHQKNNLVLSVEELLKCCHTCTHPQSNQTDDHLNETVDGCKGGSVGGAFHYWTSVGLLTGIAEDENFTANESQLIEERCTPQRNLSPHSYPKTWGMMWYQFNSKSKDTINQVKADIFFNGPVVGFFESYEYIEELKTDSLLTFDKNLVKKGEKPILHAVKVIGWDFKNNIPVWIIANSWGTGWCAGGFCYIPQGVNELKVEEFGMVGSIPNIRSLNYRLQRTLNRFAASSTERNDGKMVLALVTFLSFCLVF